MTYSSAYMTNRALADATSMAGATMEARILRNEGDPPLVTRKRVSE
jgi:predicted TIM-barrel enzyme